MQTSAQQRIKLLYLMKILLDKTDENHPLTVNELSTELTAYGINVGRKTIYADLELLKLFNLDIEKQRGRSVGYYIASRQFELPELKLLVDAVQSSRFITEKKSKQLIDKLSSLTSQSQAGQLRRQVYVENRAKSFNELAYYSVDAIHNAINSKTKLAFKYFDYNAKKKRVYRKNGAIYQVTPVSLCWDNNKYYLIAYNAEHCKLRHYCVDRMSNATVLNEPADDFDKNKHNAVEHMKSIFGMYNGETVSATMVFDASLINNILDQFGKDVTITAIEDGKVEVKADVSAGPVFLSWIFQFGDRAEIKGPDSIIGAMRELLENTIKKYHS